MTDMTMTHPPEGGLLRRLWLRLQVRRHRRAQVAVLANLSDEILRDIGLERDRSRRREIHTLHDAKRFSG